MLTVREFSDGQHRGSLDVGFVRHADESRAVQARGTAWCDGIGTRGIKLELELDRSAPQYADSSQHCRPRRTEIADSSPHL
jgi:hypothetical protein